MAHRRTRLFATSIAAIAATSLALAGCSGTGGGNSTAAGGSATGDPYVLGFTSDFSGNFGYLGTGLRSGLDAYWHTLNASGGINGHPVKMVALDDASQADRGSANVTQLITQDNAVGIVGVMYSPICAGVVPILQQYQVPEICGVVSGDLVNPVSPWVYATTTDQASYAAPQVSVAQKLMNDSGKKNVKVAILYATGSSAIEQWAKAVNSLSSRLGWNVVDTEKVPQTAVDMSTELTKIIAAQPDVLILGAGNDSWVTAGTAQLKAAGNPFPIVSYDVPSWATVQKIADNSFYYVSALAYPNPSATDPGMANFISSAKATKVDPSGPYVLRGYLQAAIFADALKHCGWPCSGAQLKAALDQTNLNTGGLVDGNAKLSSTNHTPVVSLAAYQWPAAATAPKVTAGGLPAGTTLK